MAETYFVWYFIVKLKIEAKATKLTWLLWIVGAALTVVVDSLGLNWSYKTNFVCRALPWFMIGYLVKEHFEFKFYNVKNFTLLFIAIVGWIITLSAVVLETPVDYNYVGVLLTAPSLFMIGVKNHSIKISRPIEFIAEKLSLFIYIFHRPVSSIIAITAKYAGIDRNSVYLYLHPILTLIATVLVAMVFEYVFRNKKLKRLIH